MDRGGAPIETQNVVTDVEDGITSLPDPDVLDHTRESADPMRAEIAAWRKLRIALEQGDVGAFEAVARQVCEAMLQRARSESAGLIELPELGLAQHLDEHRPQVRVVP